MTSDPEPGRLAALERYDILDTPPEAVFDDLARLAAAVCGTPVALVNLLAHDRQFFKARFGMDAPEPPASVSLCRHTVVQGELCVITDASQHERFASNPLVAGEPHIRFYAGMPLTVPGGYHIGSLCVIDLKPRTLSAEQADALRTLARQVVAQLELRRQVAEQAETEARFRAFMDNSPAVAFIKDQEGRYVYVNGPLEERFTRAGSGWLGKTDFELWSPELAAELRAHDRAVLDQGPLRYLEPIPTPDGEVRYWDAHKFPVYVGGQVLLGGMAVDVTEQTLREHRLEALSRTDALTGLFNRRGFSERLASATALSTRSSKPLTLVLLDVDHFKGYNDAFGHPAGDEVLRRIAGTLQQGCREGDTVARIGGEEFAVLLPDTGVPGGVVAAERLRLAVEGEAWPLRPVTVSLGVSELSFGCGETLMQAADKALYRAKQEGRNRVSWGQVETRVIPVSNTVRVMSS